MGQPYSQPSSLWLGVQEKIAMVLGVTGEEI